MRCAGGLPCNGRYGAPWDCTLTRYMWCAVGLHTDTVGMMWAVGLHTDTVDMVRTVELHTDTVGMMRAVGLHTDTRNEVMVDLHLVSLTISIWKCLFTHAIAVCYAIFSRYVKISTYSARKFMRYRKNLKPLWNVKE